MCDVAQKVGCLFGRKEGGGAVGQEGEELYTARKACENSASKMVLNSVSPEDGGTHGWTMNKGNRVRRA